ncbi:MAG: MTH938/NDUFAF3 family protein [Candidatus Altiarchaeota archaeon]
MKIDSYKFGRIVINGKEYKKDLIILPDRIRENWFRKEGHELCLEDIPEIFENKYENFTLIIGTGYNGLMQVPEDVIKRIKAKGIDVIIKTTNEAVKIFNEKAGKEKVIAAFHLTC